MSSYNYCSNVPARTSNIPDVIAALWSFCRCGGAFKHRSFIPIWMQNGVTFIHFLCYTVSARAPNH
jgi:hypothetical protein